MAMYAQHAWSSAAAAYRIGLRWNWVWHVRRRRQARCVLRHLHKRCVTLCLHVVHVHVSRCRCRHALFCRCLCWQHENLELRWSSLPTKWPCSVSKRASKLCISLMRHACSIPKSAVSASVFHEVVFAMSWHTLGPKIPGNELCVCRYNSMCFMRNMFIMFIRAFAWLWTDVWMNVHMSSIFRKRSNNVCGCRGKCT